MEARTVGVGVSGILLLGFAAVVTYSLQSDSLENKLRKGKEALAAAQSGFDSAQDRGRRAEKRLADAKRDRDAIKALMDRHNGAVDAVASTKKQIAQQRKRLDELSARKLAAIERVRTIGIGMEFPNLSTGSGKPLEKAKLQRVGADSLTFSHSLGYATVNWRALPSDLVERFKLGDPEPEVVEANQQAEPPPDEPTTDPALLVPPPSSTKDQTAILNRMEKIKLQMAQLRTVEAQWNRKAGEYQILQARAQGLGRPSSHSVKAQQARQQAERVADQIQVLERALLELGHKLDAIE